jgi:hypothetical protein
LNPISLRSQAAQPPRGREVTKDSTMAKSSATEHAEPRVFVSYAQEDSDFAQRITRILAASGIVVLPRSDDIRVGEAWEQKIRSQIEDSDRLVFVVPSREGVGKNALFELGLAYGLGKKIVAIMPDETRGWNADFARRLSGGPILDASRVDDRHLVEALAPAS